MPHDDFSKIDEEYFDTILDENFVFEGTINIPESIIIKGYTKGKIKSNGTLIVGPKSVIEANIIVKNLHCFGKIIGNAIVEEEAYFHYPSEINGDIEANMLTFEKGCFLNGHVSMKKQENPQKTEV